jgi:hypothetical protein
LESDGREGANELMRAFDATIPLKRIASPQGDCAGILFFAGDPSRYCTNLNLVIDGGLMGRESA